MLKFISEIKNRFFLLIITWLSVSIVFYFYKEVLLFLITRSHIFFYDQMLTSSFTTFYFIFTDVTEIFTVYIDLIFFLSFQVFFLYFIYHSFFFIAPATFKFEYFYLIKMLQITLSLWFFFAAMINFFLVPVTWNFFLSFSGLASVNLYFEARLSEYLSFYINLYYLCIFYLQVFIVLFFFFSYNKMDERFIRKYRKLYYYFFVVFSTLISPPDISSQILISIFIVCLYEFLVLIILFKRFVLVR